VTIYKLNYTVLSALIYNSFGHLTLILLLHYFVKCRLLNRLFASGVSVCHLHLCWRRTFYTSLFTVDSVDKK